MQTMQTRLNEAIDVNKNTLNNRGIEVICVCRKDKDQEEIKTVVGILDAAYADGISISCTRRDNKAGLWFAEKIQIPYNNILKLSTGIEVINNDTTIPNNNGPVLVKRRNHKK